MDTSLLNEKQVAMKLGVSLACTRRWRVTGRGPRYLKLGASVRYRAEDVEAWLESCPSGGERAVEKEHAA